MQAEFGGDRADADQPINEAAAERPGKAIRVRVQPMILRGVKGKGQYHAWKDVRWTLECDTPAEAFAVRGAMQAFFKALTHVGPEAVQQALDATNGGKETAA